MSLIPMPLGTIVNAIAVLIGGAVGLVLHDRLPQKVKVIVFQGLGLSTIVIGMKMALDFESLVPLVFSMLLGGVFGECISLEERLEKAGDFCLASQAQQLFTPAVVNQLTAVGGILLIGLAFNLLDIKKVKVTNMLPALLVIVLLTLLLQ